MFFWGFFLTQKNYKKMHKGESNNKSTVAKSRRQGWSLDIERESQPMVVSRLSAISYLTGWAKVMALPS